MYGISFFVTSVGLGAGLAMDAVSVSVADSIREPGMSIGKKTAIAFTFGAFQFVMPLMGWFLVKGAVMLMGWLLKFTPWLSLIILFFLGIRMIREGREDDDVQLTEGTGSGQILIQGVATSIDALSVGFTIADYTFGMALTSTLTIGLITFGLCMAALYAGRFLHGKLPFKETALGGIILILIGIRVFIDGIF